MSESTKSTYRHGYKIFCQFLSSIGIAATDYKPTPISEQTLILFVTHCNKALGLGYSTIKLYLAAVRFYYVKAGIHNPMSSSYIDCCAKLHMVLRGIKKHNHQKERRRPITYKILLQIHTILQRGMYGKFLDSMLKAAFSLAFFAFLRCGEFTVKNFKQNNILNMEDVIKDSDDKGFTLKLKSSKTDPFRKGIQIRVFKSGQAVCPFTCMNKYLEMRKIWNNGYRSSALFIDDSGNPLTRNFLVNKLKCILQMLGYNDEQYNGHSFRIGAATSAAEGQVQDHMIKTLGRWSSDCYNRYVRTDDDTLSRAQRAMCHN